MKKYMLNMSESAAKTEVGDACTRDDKKNGLKFHCPGVIDNTTQYSNEKQAKRPNHVQEKITHPF
ncbi:MAG: hypothetical protein Q7J65_02400 [Candidatus Marinimicrobia bacterium]|nr:hypothetical protein [Candidatus Neomarinimicrobiota bacterium]